MLAGGFDVYVARDDGTRFNEHKVEVEQSEGATKGSVNAGCYLESEEGKTFNIIVDRHDALGVDWAIQTFVDGRSISNKILFGGEKQLAESKIRYQVNGRPMTGRLTFSRLQVTDNEGEVTIDTDVLKNLGTITIELRRGMAGGVIHNRPVPVAQAEVGVAHERSKKPTDAKEIGPRTTTRVFTTYDQQPYHVFTFKYRIRPVLQMLGVVGGVGTPSQVHVSSSMGVKRKHKNDSVELDSEDDDYPGHTLESKSLLRRRLELLEQKADILHKQQKGSVVEPIDLTEDDGED